VPIPQLFAAALALAPGAYGWWSGRRLAARPDDPALPELLLARTQRLVQMYAVSGAVLIVLVAGGAYWLPLMLLALLAGG